MEGEGYTGPTQFTPDNVQHLLEVRQTENFEGMHQWAIGLDEERPFGVELLASPPRIVIDIASRDRRASVAPRAWSRPPRLYWRRSPGRSSVPSTGCAGQIDDYYWSAVRPSTGSPGSSTTPWLRRLGRHRDPRTSTAGGRGITEAALALNRVAASGAGDERLVGAAPHDVRAEPGGALRQRAAPQHLPATCRDRATCTWRSGSPSPTPAPTPAASPRAPSTTGRRRLPRAAVARSGPSKALESEVVLLLTRDRRRYPGTASAASRCSWRTWTRARRHPPDPEAGAQRRRDAARSPTTTCRCRAGAWSASVARLPAPAARLEPRTHPARRDVVRHRRARCAVRSPTREREVFGRPIGANQSISHPLAERPHAAGAATSG